MGQYISANQMRTIEKSYKQLGIPAPYLSMLTLKCEASDIITRLELRLARCEKLDNEIEVRLSDRVGKIRSALREA